MRSFAFDSNVLTYCLETSASGQPPTQDREDRIAALLIFLYGPRPFIVPTVDREAAEILDEVRRHAHWSNICTLYHDVLSGSLDQAEVDRRTEELCAHHSDVDDCRIVAEVEAAGLDTLVTFDQQLRRRLGARTAVLLTTPTDAWSAMAIPRGAAPEFRPLQGHPLYGTTWWLW